MAGRSSSSRPRRQRIVSPRLIVACEGKKAEYDYFLELNKSLRGPDRRAALKIVRGAGGTAINVIDRAIRQRKEDLQSGKFSARDGDKAYAVIDVEPHDTTKQRPLQQALACAAKTDVRVLLSNPSFDVWLLCHVQTADQMKRAFTDPQEAKRLHGQLTACGHGQSTTAQSISNFVMDASTAARVAREVHERHHGACADMRKANACTEVYQLVEFLLGESKVPP